MTAYGRQRQPGKIDPLATFLPFSPSGISGLKLWLRADGTRWQDSARTTPATADTHPIGAWDDASGAGNHFTQATAGKRPLLKTGIVNSLPVLRFDGSNDTLVTAVASGLDSASFTQFVVMKKATTGDTDILGTGSMAGSGNTEWYFLSEKPSLGQENTSTVVTGSTSMGTSSFKALAVQHDATAVANPTFVADTSSYDAFGVLCQLAGGTLLYAYRQGASHSGSGDYGVLKYRTSTDNGATWSSATTILTEASVDLRNLAGGVTSGGRIVLAFARYNPATTGWLSQSTIYSDDNGATWSTPVAMSLTGYTLTAYSPHGKMIATDDGQLLMPWYGETATDSYCFASKSTDNGATWSTPIAVISGSKAGSPNTTFTEWCPAPIGGGVIVGLCRADNGTTFTQVISTDNGATWSTQGLCTFDTWSSATPNTPPWLQVVGSRVFAFYGNRNTKYMRVASAPLSSLTGGTTGWGNVADLFSVGVADMGYASVAVLSTGRIVGVSYWGKSGSDADLYAWSWPASATAVTSGTVDGVGRLGKTFNTGTYAWVGSERDLAQYLNGDIAELIRYNRALTIDEVNLVGQYLAAKYAIAWAGL